MVAGLMANGDLGSAKRVSAGWGGKVSFPEASLHHLENLDGRDRKPLLGWALGLITYFINPAGGVFSMGSTSGKRPVSELEISTSTGERLLSKPEFQGLAEVPPEVEWFANLEKP